MNTNAGSTHRLHELPCPAAVSAAFRPNAWAAVPPARGSPPGRYLAGSGLLAAPPAAGAGEHAAAVTGERRPS
jgi:hypothetical protein